MRHLSLFIAAVLGLGLFVGCCSTGAQRSSAGHEYQVVRRNLDVGVPMPQSLQNELNALADEGWTVIQVTSHGTPSYEIIVSRPKK